MQFLGFCIIGGRGTVGSFESPEMIKDAFVRDRGGVFGASRCFVNTLWKRTLGSIAIPVSRIIPDVFSVRANSKITQPIIESISVDMINDQTIDLEPTYMCSDPMGGTAKDLPSYGEAHLYLLWSPGRFLKHSLARILSVLSPLKGTCFWIVNKLLAKCLFGWKNSRRSHSGVAVCDLGAFQSNELCDAPFF